MLDQDSEIDNIYPLNINGNLMYKKYQKSGFVRLISDKNNDAKALQMTKCNNKRLIRMEKLFKESNLDILQVKLTFQKVQV